jgi:hypothetical protein
LAVPCEDACSADNPYEQLERDWEGLGSNSSLSAAAGNEYIRKCIQEDKANVHAGGFLLPSTSLPTAALAASQILIPDGSCMLPSNILAMMTSDVPLRIDLLLLLQLI